MKEAYLQSFAERREGEGKREQSWLTALRQDAMAAFAEKGFPTHRDEDWKYASLSTMQKIAFHPRPNAARMVTPSALPLPELGAYQLVFVDGRYAPSLSQTRDLPRGVMVKDLATMLESDPAALEKYLSAYAGAREDGVKALNTAFAAEGAFVRISRGCVLGAPIHLVFLATRPESDAVAYFRNVIVAEESAQARIVETYLGTDSGSSGPACQTNAVSQLFLAENSQVEHLKLQRESETTFHLGEVRAELLRDSRFSGFVVSLGGALARNETRVILNGEGAECRLFGLYGARGRQQVDNTTLIDHARPNCRSEELYKGVLDGSAKGAFSGKVLVRLDAQKSDASQTNRNLLLSRDAIAHTRPLLMIYADDVKCSHGATVGQLDDEAIFYLRSRGIDPQTTRRMLTRAFVADALDPIPREAGRESIERIFQDWLLDPLPPREAV